MSFKDGFFRNAVAETLANGAQKGTLYFKELHASRMDAQS